MARRLPQLATDALRLARSADRRAVLWLAALQLAWGALTAVGPYSTRGAFTQLFAAGPPTDRLQHRCPPSPSSPPPRTPIAGFLAQ